MSERFELSTIRSASDTTTVRRTLSVEDLAALARESLRVGQKNGSAIVGATFRPGPSGRDGYRNLEHLEAVTVIGLDIDNEVLTIDDVLPAIPWEGVAYSSYSSTADSPRFRIFLPLKRPVSREEYFLLWDWLASQVGGVSVFDANSRDAVHLFFLPRVPDEEALEQAWVRTLEGPRLDPDKILSEIEEQPEPPAPTLPVPTADFEEARGVLARVSKERADGYQSWIAVGMCLKSVEDSPRMLDLWDEWSRSSLKYEEGACERMWGSFRGEGRTIRSLVRMAQLDSPCLPIAQEDVLPAREEWRKTADRCKRSKKLFVNEIATRLRAELVSENEYVVRDFDGVAYRYDGRCWKEVTTHVLECRAMHIDEEWATTQARRRECVSHLLTFCQAERKIRWGQIKNHEVPLQSGVLDLIHMEERPHSWDDWLERVIPFRWNRHASCPTWLGALRTWFGCDEDFAEKVRALQEFFGYVLMQHARFKKALMLYGDPNTGKSAVVTVLQNLVGRENICSIKVENMDEPEALAPIKGKALNVISELTSKSMIADGGFKQLVSTGDAVLLNEKYQRREIYFPTAKHVIATNTLPGISDRSWGTFERLMLISFNRPIPEEKMDRALDDHLLAEMEGIVSWSIEGAARLIQQRGQFTKIASAETQLREYRDDQNPMGDFFSEYLVEDVGMDISLNELRRRFCDWYGSKVSPVGLGLMLKGLGLETVRRRNSGGKQRYLSGYKFKS